MTISALLHHQEVEACRERPTQLGGKLDTFHIRGEAPVRLLVLFRLLLSGCMSSRHHRCAGYARLDIGNGL